MPQFISRSDQKDAFKKRTFTFSVQIIRFLQNLPRNYIFYTICKQLIRSATSIAANVVEAKASSSKKDFINFFSYALKSANETMYWLELLLELLPEQAGTIEQLKNECEQISKILASSIITMRKGLANSN